MKCERCNKRAVFHITEILDQGRIEEVHLCEEHGQEYLTQPIPGTQMPAGLSSSAEGQLLEVWDQVRCPECGITLKDFRNTGRLGCPSDYEHFRDQLQPLLESIHGELKHTGKMPARQDKARQLRQEIARLRRELQELINAERYEEAARLRDRIRELGG